MKFAEFEHRASYSLDDWQRDLHRTLFGCLRQHIRSDGPVVHDVHLAPQAWHIDASLQRDESIDAIWHLNSASVTRLPDFLTLGAASNQAESHQRADKAARQVVARASHSYSRLGPVNVSVLSRGDTGWRQVESHFSPRDVASLCAILQADYTCLGFEMPAACRRPARVGIIEIAGRR